MAKLLLVRSTAEVKEMTDTDFSDFYYTLPNWQIVTIADKTVAELKADTPLIEIFPYHGDIKNPAWVNPADGKTYKCKVVPPYRYKCENGLLKNTIDTYPENLEDVLDG